MMASIEKLKKTQRSCSWSAGILRTIERKHILENLLSTASRYQIMVISMNSKADESYCDRRAGCNKVE
jgi:hypothetical protein